MGHHKGCTHDGDRSKEDEDEEFSQTEVAKRLGSGGIGHGSGDRQQTEHCQDRPTAPDQIETGHRRRQQDGHRRYVQLAEERSDRPASPASVPDGRRCPRRVGNRRRRSPGSPRPAGGAPRRTPRARQRDRTRSSAHATAQPTRTGEIAAGSVFGRMARSQAERGETVAGGPRAVDMATIVPRPVQDDGAFVASARERRQTEHYGMISGHGDVWFRQGRMSGRCVPRRPRPRKNGQPRAAESDFAFAA